MITAKLRRRQAENLQESLGKPILHHDMLKIQSYDRVNHISATYNDAYYVDRTHRKHNFDFIADGVEYNIKVEMQWGIKDPWMYQDLYLGNPYKFTYTITKCNEDD